MRRFLIIGHKAAVSPEFSLNDLPGAAGRIDVLCRSVGAAFFLSHGIRRDVEVTLLLQDKIRVRLLGERLKHLNPDERSTAALIKHALEKLGEDEVESTPGIYISPGDLSATLDRVYQLGGHPVVLHENGNSFHAPSIPADPTFVLSDHMDFSDDEERLLADLPHISLGERAMHASQCITIVNYLLDRQEDQTKADLVTCYRVWGEPKAMLVKGLLEDFGIPVNLVSHVPPSVLPLTVDGLAEMRIMVREGDEARAKEIIAEYFYEPDKDDREE